MSCQGEHRLISEYIDGALSPRQEAALLAHLERCPHCAALLSRYRQMEVLLRRTPESEPSPEVRERVLAECSAGRVGWLPYPRSAVAAAAALLIVFGLVAARTSAWRPAAGLPPALAAVLGSTRTPQATPVDSAVEASPAAVAENAVAADDARVLAQVQQVVDRAGFRPLLPRYLPAGARLNAVNFGRAKPGDPIDRLEVAFAAGDKQIRLQQLSAKAAATERLRLESQVRPRAAKVVVVTGREWRYVRRADQEQSNVLIGQVNGITVWLESSLPVDELTKVAASLEN